MPFCFSRRFESCCLPTALIKVFSQNLWELSEFCAGLPAQNGTDFFSETFNPFMPNSNDDARPGLAILANVMAPYRANLHRMVAAEIPELKLHSLITHGVGDFNWDVAASREINVVNFSASGEHPQDNPLRRPVTEWRKA